MVKVFFQSLTGSYIELVATFQDEELYMACLPQLEASAKRRKMIVFESINANLT